MYADKTIYVTLAHGRTFHSNLGKINSLPTERDVTFKCSHVSQVDYNSINTSKISPKPFQTNDEYIFLSNTLLINLNVSSKAVYPIRLVVRVNIFTGSPRQFTSEKLSGEAKEWPFNGQYSDE